MKRSLLRYGLAAASAITIFAAAVDVSLGATGSKVCNATGVTTAVGIQTFGAGARLTRDSTSSVGVRSFTGQARARKL